MDEMKEKLKKQKLKRYALYALAAVIVVGVALSLNIDKADKLLEDGQGNIAIGQGEDQEFIDADSQEPGNDEAVAEKNEDSDDDKDADKEDKDDEDDKETADSKSSDETKPTDSGSNDGKNEKSKTKDGKSNESKPKNSSDPGKKTASGKTTQEISELSDAEKKEIDSKDIKIDNSKDVTASNEGNEALKPDSAESVTVTLEIRCDTLSKDMSKLENEAIREYIPENGIILKSTSYSGTTENTVFDALNTLCRNNGIQLEFSYTPLYSSHYIEGINYLYEFDGGPQSGWMYSVNGWFPNYGCSNYYLSNGDHIVWCYTCTGLGADVGATM